MTRNVSTNGSRCTYERHDGKRQHIWEKRGLDIQDEKLVRVRRCNLCGAEKYVPYEKASRA